MPFYLRIIFILLLIDVTSYSQKIAFKNYSVSDGLPSSEVYMLTQDTKGYMWFCTDAGVCKYDGYSFKTYTSENGLPDNTIFNLFDDKKSRIWFIGMSKKLSYYDSNDDSIKLIACNDKLALILTQSTITSFYMDENDVIYIGLNCGKSFYKILPQNNYKTILPIVFPDIGWQIYFPDKENVVWGVISKDKSVGEMILNTKLNLQTKVKKEIFVTKNYSTIYSSRFRYFVKVKDGFVFSEDNIL